MQSNILVKMNSTAECNINSTEGFIDGKNCATQRTLVVINCALNAPLILISISGNTLVVVAMIKTPRFRSSSMVMLLSLAVSDLLVGLISQPFFVASELTMNSLLEKLSEMIEFILCGISICTMTAISVDRFMAVQYPMRYQSAIITRPRVTYASITVIWIVNVSSLGLYLWHWPTYFGIMAVCLFACLTLSTFSYVKIYLIVRQHLIQIRAQEMAASQGISEGQTTNLLRNKRSAMNTFIFYIVMILCYIPILISIGLSSISFKDWTEAWHIAETVAFFNSSINPLLYCWRLRDLRAAVMKVSKEFFCKKKDEG